MGELTETRALMIIFAISAFNGLRIASAYNTFFASDECRNSSFKQINMRSVETNSSGILKSSEDGIFIENIHCELLLKPPLSYGVTVSIRLIDIPAHTKKDCHNYLEIFTNEKHSVKLCGYSHDVLEFSSYDNWGPMTIVFHTTNHSASENLQFQLTFTTVRKAKVWCPPDEFLCANERCIWKGLTCDSHNNCGDLSDEGSQAKCANVMSVTESVGIVIGTVILCVIFVTAIACLRKFLVGTRFQRLSGRNCSSRVHRVCNDGYQSSVDAQNPTMNSANTPQGLTVLPTDPPPKYEDIQRYERRSNDVESNVEAVTVNAPD